MSGRVITVDFRQDTIFAVDRDDGIFVAVKPIADSLGLAWQSQQKRLKDDPVLSKGITTVVIPSPSGAQETTVLRLNLIPGWLFKIDSRRVNDASKAKLIAYQEECYAVLHAHFYGSRQAPELPHHEDTAEGDSLKLRKVAEARQSFGTRASAQLWFKLGLDVVPAMYEDPRQRVLFGLPEIRQNQPGPDEGDKAA